MATSAIHQTSPPSSMEETPTLSPAPLSTAVVKLSLRGETFRISFPLEQLTWANVTSKVDGCYDNDNATQPTQWSLLFRDNEDDLVTVSSALEFQEARRVFEELKAPPPSTNTGSSATLHMHFHVLAKISLKDQLAPLLLHMASEISEKMTKLAHETRESLRKSSGSFRNSSGSYVSRGRESLVASATYTRDSLSSVGRGVSQRVRSASWAVAEEVAEIRRRTRTRSRFSSEDLHEATASPAPLVASSVFNDPREEFELEAMRMDMDMDNVAELLAQARAEEETAEQQALTQTGAATTTAEPQAEEEEEEEQDARAHRAHSSDAETDSTASEDTAVEWDFVRTSVSLDTPPPATLSPYVEGDEDEDEMEMSFSPWSQQIQLIRDVMPQITVTRCIETLEKHQGDLEAALVELTEL